MKHSAKAAARLERERSKQERRSARRQRAGSPAGPRSHASAATATDQPQDQASKGAATGQPQPGESGGGPASTGSAGRSGRARPGRDRGLRATASRVGAAAVDSTRGHPTSGDPTTGDPTTGDPTTGDPTTGGQAGHQKAVQLPYAIVLAGVVAGLVLMQVAKDAVRGGTFVIAGALLAASLTRLVLPEGRAGLLGSRRRLVDVALLTVLGAGLLTAGLIAHVPG
jgi:hypothetical protein